MAKLKLQGEPVGRGRAVQEYHGGQIKITTLSEIRPGLARDGSTSVVEVDCPADGVLQVELDGGLQLWTSLERFREDFPVAESRDATGSTPELPGSLPLSQVERGAAEWLVRAYRFLQVDETLSGQVAHAAAGLVEDQVASRLGLRRVSLETEHGLDALQDTTAPALEVEKPILVFLHGTASSTAGSFSGLWEPAQTAVREALHQFYGANVAALEHRTLTVGPIQNALDLAAALPDGATVHLVSHSRGGLVGELLCRADAAAQGDPFTEEDFSVLRNADQQRQLRELNELLKRKRLRVERFVRVACPARGTTLASGRLDLYFSILFNLLRLTLPAGTLATGAIEGLVAFVASIAKHRTDPAELPGLEAMMPESDLVKLLNRPGVIVDNDLTVLAGDTEGQGVWKRLGVLLLDLFYWADHDFVVNTKAMYGGAERTEAHGRFFFDQGPDVNHFSYFRNSDTTRRLLTGLTRSSGFESAFENLKLAPREIRLPARRGDDAPRPVVFVLPGIMGSQLAVLAGGKEDVVWLDPLDLARGGLAARLHIGASQVVPRQPLARTYGNLIEFLHASHDVVPFGFDWRKSLRDEAARLAHELESRIDRAARQGQPVRILAHSLGGLLARTVVQHHPKVWAKLIAHPDARVILLGTPLHGSHAITRLLCAQEPILDALALFDLKHRRKELLATIAAFPGVLELLPDDEKYRCFQANFWKEIGPAVGNDFVAPAAPALNAARALRRELEAAPLDPQRFIYVAGQAEQTPFRLELVANRRANRRLEFHPTAEGDGRVPWATIPPELATYYLPEAHGDLADHPPSFLALLELLRQGQTNRLPRQQPAVTRGAVRLRPMRGGEVAFLPDAETLEQIVRGGSTRRRRREAVPRIRVSVTHGSLQSSNLPVMVGHYVGDTIISAEAVLDRMLDGRLSGRHQLGQYPGAIGTAEVFLPEPAAVPGAIVIGLGPVGELTPGDLASAVAAGLLRHAAGRAEGAVVARSGGVIKLGTATLLVGTGAGGLSVADTIHAMLRGARQAAASVQQSRYVNRVQIESIELVELFEDRAIQAAHELNRLGALPEFKAEFDVAPVCRATDTGARRVSFQEPPGWWGRLQVTGEPDGSLKFLTLTDRARAEVTLQAVQRPLIDQFVQEAIQNVNTDTALCNTLFDLLLPLELKARAPDQTNLVLVVDDESARYPWELMRDRLNRSDKPLVVERGVLRQLQTSEYRQGVHPARTRDVLVVGDPLSKFAELPGAQREAEEIAKLLATAPAGGQPFAVATKVRCTAPEIVRELFARDYRILHLAGHGVFEYPVPVPIAASSHGAPKTVTRPVSGMVLGDDVFLTPAEVAQMRQVPELVFINCCHLGRIQPTDRKNDWHAPHRLAANLAAEFIRMGVRAVVAAGWAVDDGAALTFSRVFYQRLLAGDPFGEAVRLARSEAWNGHPRVNTWGAYQCYGDPDYRLEQAAANGPQRQTESKPVSLAEVIAELENLRSQSRQPEARPWIEGRLALLEKQAAEVGWTSDARFQSALGSASYALGQYEPAVEHLRQALAVEDAQMNLEAVEKLANAEVKLAVVLSTATPGTAGTAPPNDRAATLVKTAIDRLNHLVALAPTSERWSLLGSAQKRLALLVHGGSRKTALQAMLLAYTAANQLAMRTTGKNHYYPLLNALVAQVTAAWHMPAGRGKAKTVIDLEPRLQTALELAGEAEKAQPSFWNRATAGDGEVLRFISQSGTVTKEAVVAAYLSAAKRGCTPVEWQAVLEHLDFLTEMATSGKQAGIVRGLKAIQAELATQATT